MLSSVTEDIAGTRVFLVGNINNSMEALAESLRSYSLEPQLFDNAEATLEAGRPHVVVYVKLNGDEELALMRRHFHTARFLVIANVLSENDLINTFGHGIHGWIMNWEPMDTIVSAILHVCRGGASLSVPVLEALQRRAGVAGDIGLPLANRRGLTSRQVEILDLLSRGTPDKEIADILTLSVRTVQRHVQDILLKLDVHSREAAVATVLGEPPPSVQRPG